MNILNESKKLNLDQIFKLSIVASVLLAGFSVFYYYTVLLPQEKQKNEEKMLASCLDSAYVELKNKNEISCVTLELERGCDLPYPQSWENLEYFFNRQKQCVDIYPEASERKSKKELNDCLVMVEKNNKNLANDDLSKVIAENGRAFCFKYYDRYKFR